MHEKRFIWQLFLSYLFILILSLIGITWFASNAFEEFYLNHTQDRLKYQAQLVQSRTADLWQRHEIPRLRERCDRLAAETGVRITLIAPDGVVITDSDEDPATMDNHANRPEIVTAMSGGSGSATRYSDTLKKNMRYYATQLSEGDAFLGIVRVALPLQESSQVLRANLLNLIGASVLVCLLAGVLSYFMSRRISRPLEDVRQFANRVAQGELNHRLPKVSVSEINSLASSMNVMASQLASRIETVERQRNEFQAVLSSMGEGVVAIDDEERILHLNDAAADLLDGTVGELKGKAVWDVVRNAALLSFITRVSTSKRAIEGEFTLAERGDLKISAHGTVLRDTDGQVIGALVVLNNITRLAHLETVRQDFVANVSHELKTPLTTIKGFVELLLEGAIDPEQSSLFLEKVHRNTDRMNAIIDDLLILSRLERGPEAVEFQRDRSSVSDVLNVALDSRQAQASEKGIELELACDASLMADLNLRLFEHAVVNLIDNAIKYSGNHSVVRVEATPYREGIIVKVRDEGPGIPQENLPRLFERFYRVDTARSRKLGGTGLGLAIVKHIVQVHNGRIDVESVPGEGSTFSIYIPDERKLEP